ncbi:MAG: class I SAM-dependent RNA methyltransferase [Sandaracinaceae bacterium]|nr:class I SAM-dependent RNA methyltransferase [Sandaracinaceae bacterium]
MTAPLDLFAACAPGLEPLLSTELRELGALEPEAIDGGVRFRGHRRVIFRVNLMSGLATHVLARVGRFTALAYDGLEQALVELPWEDWLAPGVPRTFRVTARKSKLGHSGAIAERAARALSARLCDAPGESEDPVPIAIRIFRDRVHVSVDTSGAPLHRRGYRTTSGPAPLREDLARALVIASGWDRTTPLVDPLCGVGTIPIEAALLAQRRPAGGGRRFAFEQTRWFDAATWDDVRAKAAAGARDAPTILGRDRDAQAIEASLANAARAGVDVRFEQAPLSTPFGIDAPRGAVVTHPPFGKRMGEGEDLTPLYRAIRAAVPAGWALAVMSEDRRLGMKAGDQLKTAFLTDAGGLKVRALVG